MRNYAVGVARFEQSHPFLLDLIEGGGHVVHGIGHCFCDHPRYHSPLRCTLLLHIPPSLHVEKRCDRACRAVLEDERWAQFVREGLASLFNTLLQPLNYLDAGERIDACTCQQLIRADG